MTGTSPPGTLRCGSTTCNVHAFAHAASKALPPRSRMPMPTAVAIQWVEATTPKVPTISGRVVKGLGLMSFKALPPGRANSRARVGARTEPVDSKGGSALAEIAETLQPARASKFVQVGCG